MKDWSGNGNSLYVCNGASNHSDSLREENDYYATDPKAVEFLLEREKFTEYVWECACGEGHMAEVLKSHKYKVKTSDIIDRGYPNTEIIDFLHTTKSDMDIITNPPYKKAKEFVEHALSIVSDGNKVAMFLKLTFLEGQARKKLFSKYPPKTIYVFSKRIKCAKNGDFEQISSSAVAYAWFVFEKGFDGDPIIKWI